MEHVRHSWEANGKRYRALYDDVHETVGSYGYATEADTKAAEDEELANLRSGKWCVVGVVVSEFFAKPHCDSCSCKIEPAWHDTDDVWGCVVENTIDSIEQLVEMF